MNHTPRKLIATAAAVGAMLLLTSPQAFGAEPAPNPMTRWIYHEDSSRLAPGANHFRYTEDPALLAGRTAPRELNIVRMDPVAGAVRLETSFGKKAGVAETVRDQLATATPPLAGTNASFASYDRRGDGVASMMFNGLSARDGVINGSSCVSAFGPVDANGKYGSVTEGMQATVLQYGFPYISRLKSELTVEVMAEANGPVLATHVLDDVNRTPGRAMGCARDLDDVNHQKAVTYLGTTTATTVFQDPDELIVFNGNYGVATPPKNLDTDPAVTGDDAEGTEIVIDQTGRIAAPKAARGGENVAAGGYALQAIGTGSETWLKANATAGRYLRVVQKVIDVGAPPLKSTQSPTVEAPRPIAMDESTDIVSSTHGLISDGVPRTNEDLKTCKRLYDKDNNSVGKVANRPRLDTDFCRDSRTSIGVDEQGRTLLITITGPRDAAPPATEAAADKTADGAFMWEVRDILAHWGAVDAMNLDGGGSTTMVTHGVRQTGRTDTVLQDGVLQWAERTLGDSVYVGRGGTPLP